MSRRPLLEWCFLLVVVTFYLPTLAEVGYAWSNQRYAAHGILAPALGALILWNRRQQLRRHSGPSSSAGLVLLAAAVGLTGIGHATQSVTAHALSLVLAVSGIGLWIRGHVWMRHAVAAFAFLLFMLPLPRAIARVVTIPLQHFAVVFAAGALELLQVPVSRAGIRLHLTDGTIRVAEGCNGLGFLLVLLTVTTAFALIWLPRDRRLMVILAAIPAGILANALRVTTIAAVAHLIGPDAPIGFLDEYVSKAFWLLALASTLGFGVLVGRNRTLLHARVTDGELGEGGRGPVAQASGRGIAMRR